MTAERITAAEVARLADLGIRVTDRKNYDLPQPDFIMRSDVYLYTDFGAVGVVYPYVALEGSQTWYVHPVDMKLIQPYIDDIFGRQHAKADYYWTMPFYLNMFEGIAEWLASGGVPREHVGDIWALHCMVALAEKRAKKPMPSALGLQTTAAAVMSLTALDVTPTAFYEHFYRTYGNADLQTTMAAIEFEAAHPGVHAGLLQDLFA